jgi:hypothetical protein
MAAQISQFSKCIQRKMIKSFSEQIGGSRALSCARTVTRLPRVMFIYLPGCPPGRLRSARRSGSGWPASYRAAPAM